MWCVCMDVHLWGVYGLRNIYKSVAISKFLRYRVVKQLAKAKICQKNISFVWHFVVFITDTLQFNIVTNVYA